MPCRMQYTVKRGINPRATAYLENPKHLFMANRQSGFTILEVMVALAIIGISIGIFFGMIGNSARLREKIDVHARSLLLARCKTEEALLGILKKKPEKQEEKKVFAGTSKDGVPWKVTETDKYKETKQKNKMDGITQARDKRAREVPPKNTMLLSICVEGITIDTICFREEKDEEDESTDDGNGGEDSSVPGAEE